MSFHGKSEKHGFDWGLDADRVWMGSYRADNRPWNLTYRSVNIKVLKGACRRSSAGAWCTLHFACARRNASEQKWRPQRKATYTITEFPLLFDFQTHVASLATKV